MTTARGLLAAFGALALIGALAFPADAFEAALAAAGRPAQLELQQRTGLALFRGLLALHGVLALVAALWRAPLTPVPLWRANHAFQAVQVPAGQHRVRLRYEDKRFQLGVWISGTLALLGLAAFVVSSACRKQFRR